MARQRLKLLNKSIAMLALASAASLPACAQQSEQPFAGDGTPRPAAEEEPAPEPQHQEDAGAQGEGQAVAERCARHAARLHSEGTVHQAVDQGHVRDVGERAK